MGYVANPRPGSGFPPQHTLTSLGQLREAGTVDIDRGIMPASGGLNGEDEGLGFGGRRRRRARRARQAATLRRVAGPGTDPRRSLALRRMRPTTTRRRRGGIGGMVSRMRERARTARARQQAADAERAAGEAAQIAEAERLARETVTGTPVPIHGTRPPRPSRSHVWTGTRWMLPRVTDQNGQRWGRWRPPGPPSIHPGPACRAPRPPARAGGVWQCIRGNWSFQGIATTMPVRPQEVTNGAPAPMQPSVRPWWMGQPKDGDIPMRDTSGIPPPPGLPGGPSMRPPPSGRDTATEVVAPEAPAAGMDMAKILPLVAGAALLFLNK